MNVNEYRAEGRQQDMWKWVHIWACGVTCWEIFTGVLFELGSESGVGFSRWRRN